MTRIVSWYLFRIFLSTPSARRATLDVKIGRRVDYNFYPRPPRGGRPVVYRETGKESIFLSTPSARRATAEPEAGLPAQGQFLSTPSARRATL